MGELNPDTLLELVGKFFPEAERKQDEIKEIIALLYGHTFAAETHLEQREKAEDKN